MSYRIQQSTTAYKLMFLMVQSSDHITALTGASPTVTLSKNGAAFGSPAGAVTELANGWYLVAGNATDSNTLGPLALHATAASGDPTDMLYEVVVQDLTTATIANVTTVATLTTYTGNTPQTGDAYARLGAPAGASVSADVAAVKGDSGALVTGVNVAKINGTTVNGNGAGTPWGP